MSSPALADPSIFGAASSVADNGTGNTPATITPPGSMAANDYVTVLCGASDGTDPNAITVTTTGGQTWTSETQLTSLPSGGSSSANTVHSRLFHARFDGTWTANPVFSKASGATGANLTCVMLVFRGVDTSTAVDVAAASASYDATSNVTITGISTATNNAMVVAFWESRAANTWTLFTGGWSQSHAQIRNLAGGDLSISHAYKIQASAGAAGDVRNDQATGGPDAGHTWIIALKAAAGGTVSTGILRRRGQ